MWCPSTLPPYLFFPLLSSPLLYLSSPLLSLLPSIPLETVGDVAFCASPSNIPIACVRVCVCACVCVQVLLYRMCSLYLSTKGTSKKVSVALCAAPTGQPVSMGQDIRKTLQDTSTQHRNRRRLSSPHTKKSRNKKKKVQRRPRQPQVPRTQVPRTLKSQCPSIFAYKGTR